MKWQRIKMNNELIKIRFFKDLFLVMIVSMLSQNLYAGVGAYTWSYGGESGGVAVANGYAWCYKVCEGGCEICGTNRYYEDGDSWCQSSVYSTTVNSEANWKGDYREEAQPTGLLAIPNTLDGLPVVKVGNYALYGRGITAIELPNTVKSIGHYAFCKCSSLQDVVLPDGITYIGCSAFEECSALQQMTLPKALARIDSCAFLRCAGLSTVSFPAGLRTIGYQAFYGCSKLSALDFPDGMTSISEQAFVQCHALKSIRIPTSVTTIGNDAFSACIGNAIAVTAPFFPERVYGGTYFYYAGDDDTKPGYKWVEYGDDYTQWYYEEVSNVSHTRIGKLTIVSPICYENLIGTINTNPSSYQEGATLTFLPPIGVVTGCTFAGWVPSGISEDTKGKVTACAIWTTNNYSVTFHSNGGTGTMDNQAFVYGVEQQLSANSFIREGYSFVGWGEDSDSDVYIADNTVVSNLTADADGVFDLYAVWKKNPTVESAFLTVTNIVIHYVVNSVVPEKVYPTTYDTGFVNIITEVTSSGAVSVPATWMANYPNYITKFGSDFTKSLMKPTGKKDGANQPMCVWQDYVAGTDPTDENDVFTASITTDANGKLIISYNPELSDDEKAKRIYKTLGKVKLTDADWVEVPTGHEADYNFFKVTVEMK